ncbi:MAG: DUF4340 domain-containing protein [Myxococcaceae bacterium]|nr:DUF4340 domain-containing protein [Myxococcaceae bacterium]
MSQSNRIIVSFLVLLAIAGGVGFYAYKGVWQADEEDTKKKDVEERLFAPYKPGEKAADAGAASVDFVKLKLTLGGEASVLERASGADVWRLTAPVETNADKVVVDSITSQLLTAKFKYVADDEPDAAALQKYGLEPPAFTVEAEAIIAGGERRSVRLFGGVENTFNGSIFMRRNDEKKVWGAEGGVKWSFQRTPFDLREKQIVQLDEAKVTGIAVKTKNNEFTLERDADKQWLVKPAKVAKGEEASFTADQGGISGMISGIKNERAIGFPKELPMGEPYEDVTFELGDEKVRVKLWRIGGGDAGPQKAVAWRENKGGVVIAELPENALSFFDRNPWDLRDRSVVQFKKEAVTKLTFHLPTGPELVVEKDQNDAGAGETWRVTAPKAGPAKQFKIAALLWTVGSLKANDVVDDKPKDLKKYGFDRWVSLAGADGKELGRLWVGAANKESPGNTFVRGTRDAVISSDAQRLADLPTKVEDLLDAPAAVSGDAGP